MPTANIQDILGFFTSRVLPILQALVASGVVKTSSGIQITALLSDITSIIKGAQSPSAALVGEVDQLLKDLSADGILQGSFVNTLNTQMALFTTFVSAITATPTAQPGIGPRENLCGVEGSWVFIPDAAEASVKAALGL